MESTRTEWQHLCQGSAIVSYSTVQSNGCALTAWTYLQSALLVAVVAQLFQYFRDDGTYNKHQLVNGAKTAILALCYATLFLNIGATVFAFVVINRMGSLASAATSSHRSNQPSIPPFDDTEARLPGDYGASSVWKYTMAQCR